jgi:MSHA type pilus biogenesis protein MshL
MDALDIIVLTNNLAYEQDGGLIRVMNDKEYEKLHGERFKERVKTEVVKLNYANASEVTKVLIQLKTNVGKIISDDTSNTIVLIDIRENIEEMKDVISEIDVPLVTEVFSLDYAKVELIKDKLEQMISKNIGSMKFDERTNKLVIKDTPKKMEDIKRVIEAFDEKTRQVIIDANIMKVTLSDKYSNGIDWTTIATLGDLTIEATSNLTTSLEGTTPSTFTVMKEGGAHSSVLRLLETFGKTDVLSRPRITVADKEEAKILVGAKEIYVTSEVTTSGDTYHTADHVQFVDVGVKLAVTPEINKQGYIKLRIKPEVSDTDATKTVRLINPADGSTRTIVPYVVTSEAETTLLVKDKTTIILGGLMKDTITEYSDKIPFLGDLPVIGRLFSTKGKSKEKAELVIFLTPYIIEGSETTEEAHSYIEEWKKKEEMAKIEKPEEPRFEKPKLVEVDKNLKPIVKEEKKEEKPKLVEVDKNLKPIVKEEKKERPKDIRVAKKSKTPSKAQKLEWTPITLAKVPHKKETQKAPGTKTGKEILPKKTPYEEYYLTIRKDINDMAKGQDVSGLKGEVELQFSVDRNGFLTKGPIVLNKPDLRLVRASVNCVKKVAPFPRFPKTLKDEEEFYIVVRYE